MTPDYHDVDDCVTIMMMTMMAFILYTFIFCVTAAPHAHYKYTITIVGQDHQDTGDTSDSACPMNDTGQE